MPEQTPEPLADLVRPQRVGDRRELGAQQPHQRDEPAPVAEGERRAEQAQRGDSRRLAKAELDRGAPAHRVADEVCPLDAGRFQIRMRGPREERRVVARSRGLRRGPEPGQVDRVDGELGGERGDGLEERDLARTEAVKAHDLVGPGAGDERRDRPRRRGDTVDPHQRRPRARKLEAGFEAEREVEITADVEAAC